MPLFKKGEAPHVNNVELGRKGRWRSNVWTYPGASSLGSDARKGLGPSDGQAAAMLIDALLDVTERGDIVIDPFLGSGSTLIAAERAAALPWCEIDPLYFDVIIRRFEAETGRDAILAATGETFAALGARRRAEAALEQDSGSPPQTRRATMDDQVENDDYQVGYGRPREVSQRILLCYRHPRWNNRTDPDLGRRVEIATASFCLFLQIFDDVGAVLRAGQTKGHSRAGHEGLRIGQPFVERDFVSIRSSNFCRACE